MNYKIIFTFLIALQFSYSQNIKTSKAELLKIFKKTIVRDSNGIIHVDSNPWFTDNSNDNYKKSDTIFLKNAKSFKRNYCKIINWNFYKKDAFIIGDADYCSEPPTQTATKPKDWIELKIFNSEKDLILELYNQSKLIDKFKVISLKQEQSEYSKDQINSTLKLSRIKI
jgi:hypothetical protein